MVLLDNNYFRVSEQEERDITIMSNWLKKIFPDTSIPRWFVKAFWQTVSENQGAGWITIPDDEDKFRFYVTQYMKEHYANHIGS